MSSNAKRRALFLYRDATVWEGDVPAQEVWQ